MYTIVITKPDFFPGEAAAIAQMLRLGRADRVHIRKPCAERADVERLIREIPEELHSRLVLHDYHDLATEYALGGIHLNSRNPEPPADWEKTATSWTQNVGGRHLTISRSCHSLDELRLWHDKCDYLSLSPIFDSISKQGYKAAFTQEDLQRAASEGLIDSKVMALGGVTFARLDEVRHMGFGGGMILGDAWRIRVVLTIAGSDTSAGAGIQQDMKTVSAMDHYAVTVPTALTAQNTMGVQRVMPVPPDMLRDQLESIRTDIRVDAIKIGMIPNCEAARIIVEYIRMWKTECPELPVVCDPVMVSTSGTPLMTDDCITYVQEHLFPLCTLVTPNIPEAKRLGYAGNAEGLCSKGKSTRKQRLQSFAILLKGGHAAGSDSVDTLYLPDGTQHSFSAPRIETHNLHGTGCTLSSAIATALATGKALPEAVAEAKKVIQCGILGGRDLRIGNGNGPLFVKLS